jgi:hypothetical protein
MQINFSEWREQEVGLYNLYSLMQTEIPTMDLYDGRQKPLSNSAMLAP